MADRGVFRPFGRFKALVRTVKYYLVQLFRYPKAEYFRLDNSRF